MIFRTGSFLLGLLFIWKDVIHLLEQQSLNLRLLLQAKAFPVLTSPLWSHREASPNTLTVLQASCV